MFSSCRDDNQVQLGDVRPYQGEEEQAALQSWAKKGSGHLEGEN